MSKETGFFKGNSDKRIEAILFKLAQKEQTIKLECTSGLGRACMTLESGEKLELSYINHPLKFGNETIHITERSLYKESGIDLFKRWAKDVKVNYTIHLGPVKDSLYGEFYNISVKKEWFEIVLKYSVETVLEYADNLDIEIDIFGAEKLLLEINNNCDECDYNTIVLALNEYPIKKRKMKCKYCNEKTSDDDLFGPAPLCDSCHDLNIIQDMNVLSGRGLARVLCCDEQSVRSWKAGRKMPTYIKTLINLMVETGRL